METYIAECLVNHHRVADLLWYYHHYKATIPDFLKELNPDDSLRDHYSLLCSNLDLDDYVKICDGCGNGYIAIPRYVTPNCYDWNENYHTVLDDHGDGVGIYCDLCLDDFPYWESDERYHTNCEPDPPIDEYHWGDRDDLMRDVDMDDPSILGIELETYIPDRDEIIPLLRKYGAFYAEDDASLDRYSGVEFIFAPIPFNEINESHWIASWLKALDRHADVWSRSDYGMHISINAGAMSKLHIGKFCHFIHNNHELCRQIAGRNAPSWAAYKPLTISKYREYTLEKYYAAAIRSSTRIEVRIFKSTTKWERFRRNCEFIDAIRIFTENHSIKQLDVNHFVSYINQPKNRKVYRFLRKFLTSNQPAGVE